MDRKDPKTLAVCYAAGRCVRKCREALRPEDRLGAGDTGVNTGPLMVWFRELCDRNPAFNLIADMLRAEGRRELAGELLPDLERYICNLDFELRDRFGPPEQRAVPGEPRLVLVVDNTADKGKRSATRRGKGKGAAPPRPTGDAA